LLKEMRKQEGGVMIALSVCCVTTAAGCGVGSGLALCVSPLGEKGMVMSIAAAWVVVCLVVVAFATTIAASCVACTWHIIASNSESRQSTLRKGQTTTRARGEGAANATGLALAVGVRVILGGLTAG